MRQKPLNKHHFYHCVNQGWTLTEQLGYNGLFGIFEIYSEVYEIDKITSCCNNWAYYASFLHFMGSLGPFFDLSSKQQGSFSKVGMNVIMSFGSGSQLLLRITAQNVVFFSLRMSDPFAWWEAAKYVFQHKSSPWSLCFTHFVGLCTPIITLHLGGGEIVSFSGLFCCAVLWSQNLSLFILQSTLSYIPSDALTANLTICVLCWHCTVPLMTSFILQTSLLIFRGGRNWGLEEIEMARQY